MGEAALATRAGRLSVLARTPRAALEAALAGRELAGVTWARPGTVGMVMCEGRIGGSGARFSLGQATVARATARRGGTLGVGYVMGSDPRRAELMALADLLVEEGAADLVATLLRPQAAAQAAAREDRARAAAATTVEFFAMERESAAGRT